MCTHNDHANQAGSDDAASIDGSDEWSLPDDDDAVMPAETDDADPHPRTPLKFISRNKVAGGDGIELPGQTPPRNEFRFPVASLAELRFRHQSWEPKRLKMWRSLQRTLASDARKDRFANCGSELWLRVDKKTRQIGIACNTCRDRLCEVCGRTRGARMIESIVNARPTAPLRFITLTLRCSHSTLKGQLDRLYDCFGKLRRRTFWGWYVKGGAAFCEVKIGKNSGLWHVHLHMLVEGDFIPQRELSREWLEVTGDSSIVDVRKVENVGIAAGYVVKYASKSCDASVYNSPPKLDEFTVAMKGRRLALTFGGWRGIKLAAGDGEKVQWENIGSLDTLKRRAEVDDPDALTWVRMAVGRWPGLAPYFGLPAPPD